MKTLSLNQFCLLFGTLGILLQISVFSVLWIKIYSDLDKLNKQNEIRKIEQITTYYEM